jgi:hypothetical protein
MQPKTKKEAPNSIRIRCRSGIFSILQSVLLDFGLRARSPFRLFPRKAETFLNLLTFGGTKQKDSESNVDQPNDQPSPRPGQLVQILNIAEV